MVPTSKDQPLSGTGTTGATELCRRVRSFAACRADAEVLRDLVAQVVRVGLDRFAEDAAEDRRAVGAFVDRDRGRRGWRSRYSRSALCQAGGEPNDGSNVSARKARARCLATLLLLTVIL